MGNPPLSAKKLKLEAKKKSLFLLESWKLFRKAVV